MTCLLMSGLPRIVSRLLSADAFGTIASLRWMRTHGIDHNSWCCLERGLNAHGTHLPSKAWKLRATGVPNLHGLGCVQPRRYTNSHFVSWNPGTCAWMPSYSRLFTGEGPSPWTEWGSHDEARWGFFGCASPSRWMHFGLLSRVSRHMGVL